MDLFGDGEHLVAGEGVRLVPVACPGEGECGDRGDVSGVDRRIAARADRVEDVISLANGGEPVEGVGLWERDGRTPGEVAAALNVTTPTVVKMADRMTTAGLLTRRRDDRDNRLVRLWLTDAGRVLQKPVEAERRLIEEKVTADLTEVERETLLNALAKVHRAASELLRERVDQSDSAIT